MQMCRLCKLAEFAEKDFFSLELAQSLKKRSKAVSKVLHVGLAPGCWAGSWRTTAELALLSNTSQQRLYLGSCVEPAKSRMLTPPSSTGRLRALVRKRHRSGRLLPPGRDKRGSKWRPAATGVSLSSVRNGQWTRPNGAGTWALTCGSG